ncbi:MAG: methylmalonyl-CoA mutase family protein, partial [Solirubrobacterales bacterium]
MSDSDHRLPERDRPWVMRTYAGHSDARRSNELYRRNLAKGQTGLSVAFDLPTQTGYDPDHALARGEVGKVGVSIAHKGDMHALLDGIPLDEMNTSMTINATAAWLLGLYVTVADENGIDRTKLTGTTQNDIIKEYLSRGTYAFPPGPSMRLIADTVAFAVNEIPSWNPTNICSYHLQEAGATPVQEIAYAMSTAIAVLDEVKARGQVSEEDFPKVFGRISFFVNAGVRFVEEHAKLRAMGQIWERLGRERYGVTEPKFLRMRYGVQVNSLGLTEAQPENNVQRIVLEALAVTMGRNARARAIQLPAWNEALGLPRPWDQQWSLRIQQVLAFETDVLEYPDIFEGSKVMDGLVAELVEGADEEMKIVADQGGAVDAVAYMKARLVESHRERIARIERGEIKVIGQNSFTETEDSPLTAGADGGILTPDPEVERECREALERWKSERDQAAVDEALEQLAEAARDSGANIMPATIDAAKAGATTGEWAAVLRDVFGDYRAPTGVAGATASAPDEALLADVRARVEEASEALGHRLRILVGKPGLDGHSNGAEQIAVRARDVGMEVIYQGIRLTPEQIAASAVQEDVDVVGLSILSGSHRELVPETVRLMREAGIEAPVVVGG